MLSLLVCAASAAGPAASRLLVLRGGGTATPMQLINAQGEFVAASASSIAAGAPSGTDLSIVASVGGRSRGRKLMNALFDTEFPAAVTIGPAREETAGAWVAAASNAPNVVLLDTEPTDGLESEGPRRTAADSSKLAGLSFSLADAILVHSPVAEPTEAVLKEWYERLFINHLAVCNGQPGAKALIVHVSDASAGGESSAAMAKAACAAGWAAATATSSPLRSTAFSDCFGAPRATSPQSATS